MGDSKSPRVCLHTHGCKLNQAESETLALQLAEIGCSLVDDGPADVMLLNTCTVTHIADRKARQWLRQARRQNPDSLIIAMGCYVERAAAEFDNPGIDLMCDNQDKARLGRLIADRLGFPKPSNTVYYTHPQVRTRSFVKIQDGCHGSCTYCIVPKVRPKVHSEPPDQVVGEIDRRVALGYKEVVLTGTEIGNYHHQTDNLANLVRRILNETSIERLRLSSLQPSHVTPEMLVLWQDSRLARHFHIALQSGCNATLTTMRRRYSRNMYRETLNLIREHVPDAAITTDLIVGFPGESDRDFTESCAFVESCGFSAVHVFPFSPRPGTVAASMSHQIPALEKRERTLKALSLARILARRSRESAVGSVQEVLWETETSPGNGIYSGFTSNYHRVFTKSGKTITNLLLPTRLIRHDMNHLWGELI
ncbi:MAG: MiaB/RimO family radical SAM methylthiotransferase [Chloroflexota bacterium]